MKATTTDPWMSLALLLCRLAIGVYFVMAGIAKVRGGVQNFVDGAYAKSTPSWLPEAMAKPYGYAVPWLEILVGASVALGFFGRIGAGVMSLMLLSFMLALGIADGNKPYSTNIILFALAILLAIAGSGAFSLDAVMGKKKGA